MSPRSLKFPWPRSLAGQLIASLLLAIAAAQVVSFVIFASERREAIIGARHEQVMQRAASVIQMLDHLGGRRDRDLTETILSAATSARVRFWIAPESAVPADQADDRDNELARSLAGRLGGAGNRAILVRVTDADELHLLRPPEFIRRLHRDRHEGAGRDERAHRGMRGDHEEREVHHGPRRYPVRLVLSVALDGGEWLNGELAAPSPRGWGTRTLTVMLLMAVAVSLVSVLIVRRLTRPLNDLAAAADALGRGEVPPPLTPTGPGEVRRTTVAFNTMQERLHRFVADRTRMLAAISHDLRTPLTSLRLRAEFIKDDPENRQKILNILEEMERITEATLVFARDAQAGGRAVPTDVAALCAEVAEELRDLGLDVTCRAAGPVIMPCQPTALKRAVRNLAENGVRYGGRAGLAVCAGDGETLIVVEDDGPGIPEADQDSVFEPFTRLETSRSHETGGVGLGLAIARSIVRAHGGDIRLENLAPRGLRVTVSLPMPGEGSGRSGE
ncbi:MAG: two-component sensor histidine kinase [Rhodospirillales bacterium CG15_BIG_FIL_POST_REV_8_21_14_020_66_15]|nr:MAG: two-component sensor histidine kinase [Rhodospirillales bacterium CG15_BIG_FIL_POST_REV_8_21_14_020_66_15]